MRKITELAVDAFRNNRSFKLDNTKVEVDRDVVKMFLFDNLIAIKNPTGILISNAGWESRTTQERLNGLGAGIFARKGKWYWRNGEELFPEDEFVRLEEDIL